LTGLGRWHSGIHQRGSIHGSPVSGRRFAADLSIERTVGFKHSTVRTLVIAAVR
jgi:hypothetical protein